MSTSLILQVIQTDEDRRTKMDGRTNGRTDKRKGVRIMLCVNPKVISESLRITMNILYFQEGNPFLGSLDLRPTTGLPHPMSYGKLILGKRYPNLRTILARRATNAKTIIGCTVLELQT